MNNKILFVAVGVIGGLILGATFAGAVFPEVRNGNVGMTGTIDRHFIEQMIPHHDGAIAMATLALEKAVRPEIKTLAEAVIRDQNKEIGDMRGWYKNWFQTEVPKGNLSPMGGGMMSGSGMHMGGQEDMRTLENANDFDKAFIEAMIPHHQLAVMMAQMLKSGTNRPEMLSLANNIIESQSREIQEMQSWYKSWYN
ncbi:MAG: DUF305 domain-containing protein [Candidatus Paceibacterota bacterium]|jgi:uncharacterized protein (DUF305 family)|nr:DUF305 domain-containing protein [Ignavibacteriaceae bacterium]